MSTDLPDVDVSGSSPVTEDEVIEAMKDVIDPELGINVVDLGLVYGVNVDQQNVATIDMTLTSAACPLGDIIEDQAAQALEGIVKDQQINWVWMPPWGPERITDEGRDQLRASCFNVYRPTALRVSQASAPPSMAVRTQRER